MAQYDDITQVPFVSGQGTPQQSPLLDVPTDALRAQIGGTPGPDNLPIEPLAAYQDAIRIKDRTDAIQKAQLDLERTDAQQNSFMPKFIATVAALKGDFRPLIQMEEQKRATAIGKALFPTQLKINEYKDKGDYESAENLANTAYQAAGARSRELVPYFQQLAGEISKKRTEVQNMKAAWEMLDAQVGDDKTNPNYKAVKALGTLVKNHTPVTEAIFNQVMTSMRPQTNISDVKAVTVSPWSNDIVEKPLTHYAPSSAADTISGKEVVQVHQLKSTADITNLQKGIGVTDINGQVIAPDSQRAQNIIQEMSTRQKDEAAYELKKMIVTDPMLNSAYIASGAGTIKDLAKGNITDVGARKAFDFIQERKIAEMEAGPLAAIMKDPYKWAQSGGTFVNKDLKEAPLKTVFNAEQQGLTPVRQKVFDEKVVPLKERIQGLDYAAQMASELGKLGVDLSTPGGRLSLGVKRLASDWLGFTVDDKVAVAETIASIMNKAVEDVNRGLKGIDRPSAEIGRIKKYTAGDFSNPQDAINALTTLQGKLKQELLNSVDATPQTALPSSPGSVYSPKGGGRIPKGAAVTKGDVEGALKKSGVVPTGVGDKEAERHMKWLKDNGYLQEVPEGATATPTTPTAPTVPIAKKPYTLIPGSGR